MASAIMPSSQLLPRFLLPKLSWASSTSSRHVSRGFSVLSNQYPPLKESSRGRQNPSFNQTRPRQNTAKTQSSVLYQLSQQRSFHATSPQYRDHHFDTLKFVQRLKDEGFSEEQAVAMMRVLSDVIEERYDIGRAVLHKSCEQSRKI